MRAAAVASENGIDPLAYLGLEADDRRLVNLVIEERIRRAEERERIRLDYLAGKTAELIVQPLTKWLGTQFKQLVKAGRGRGR